MPQTTKNIKPNTMKTNGNFEVEAPKTSPSPVGDILIVGLELSFEGVGVTVGVGVWVVVIVGDLEGVGVGVLVAVGVADGALVGAGVGVFVGVGTFVGVGVGVGVLVAVGTGVEALFEEPLLAEESITIFEEPSGLLPAVCVPTALLHHQDIRFDSRNSHRILIINGSYPHHY